MNHSSKLYRGLELLLSLPKSFYVSWRLTSFKRAFKLPVLCRFNVKLMNTCGKLTGGGRLYIGFNQTSFFDVRFQRAILDVAGTIELNGNFSLGAGGRLLVGRNGKLIIGGQVSNSAGLSLCCADRIEIGGNTVISWDTMIMDKDFHYILDVKSGMTKPDHKPIKIGKGAWVCAGSKITKGAVLPDGCILGAGAVLNGAFDESNCLLIGNPAMIVKHGITRSDKPLNDNCQ